MLLCWYRCQDIDTGLARRLTGPTSPRSGSPVRGRGSARSLALGGTLDAATGLPGGAAASNRVSGARVNPVDSATKTMTSRLRKGPKAGVGPTKPLTMADLARLAGVSKITVSRAMSDTPLVNAKTRARVRALAAKFGYKLNASARNLRLRRSHTVAVVVEMTPTADRPMSHPYPLD